METTRTPTIPDRISILRNVEAAIAAIPETELAAQYQKMQAIIDTSTNDQQVRAACYGQDLILEELVSRGLRLQYVRLL